MKFLKCKIHSYVELYKKDPFGFFIFSVCNFLSFVLILTMPIFTFRVGFNLITNIISILFCLCSFLYIYTRGEFKIDLAIGSLIIFCIYSLASWVVTRYSFDIAQSTFTLYILIFFIYEFILNTKSFNKFLIFYLMSGLLLAVFIFISDYRSIISFHFDRLGSTYGNVNSVGLTLSLCGILCTYFCFVARKKYVLFSLLYFVFLFFVFLTGSRAALLIDITGSFVCLWCVLKGKKKAIFLAFFILLVVAVILLLNLPAFEGFKERIVQALISLLSGGSSADKSANIRFEMIKEGLYLWLRSPAFGHGLDSFRYITNFHEYAHATIGDMLCNLGIFGFVLWIFPSVYSVLHNHGKGRVFSFVILLGIILPGIFCSILSTSKPFMFVYCFSISGISIYEKNVSYISIKSSRFIPKIRFVFSDYSMFAKI